jgi:signal transduction histidine kinase
MLRPLGLVAAAAVVVGALNGHPRPGLHGDGLGLTLALCAFVATIALAIRDRFVELRWAAQAAVIATLGGTGVALAALQPHDATELAGGAAVWMAITRLPVPGGVALATAITVALDVATAIANGSADAVLATTLLCALLGLVAYFIKQARESQDRTEILLAQLQEARDEQAKAAAVAERGRIAGELHDVLAHSLSAAAIQLQGARVLADRQHVGAELGTAIGRASELVKDGLADARQAVGALRGDELPGVGQLDSLVASFRRDMKLNVTLAIEGTSRKLPADASLALYRGAQEALTNAGRYAFAASVSVILRYEPERVLLTVEDRLPGGEATAAGNLEFSELGGGRGLASMRERIARAGGQMRAGPTGQGWRVELEVPS